MAVQLKKKAEALLWRGELKEVKSIFLNIKSKQAQNFCAYLSKHSERIIDYNYYSSNKICSIGSGAVESTIKQIDRRIKISGAQWKKENVTQVLYHRCAYLNNLI